MFHKIFILVWACLLSVSLNHLVRIMVEKRIFQNKWASYLLLSPFLLLIILLMVFLMENVFPF